MMEEAFSMSVNNDTPAIHRPTREERGAQYKPGSIRRVKLQNFLTYANVEFEPGPRLNVVVGPNGTGKSTILCAICLGLGGQPPLLGRADDARTFIMHEKEIAMIEIELSPHTPTSRSTASEAHVIKRVIDRNKGSERGKGAGASTYYINGTKCSAKDVRTLVTDVYHISVDNLCTFLPQDRVGSFSGFNPQMLLQETEKSLSRSKHLYETHMKLIELENELLTRDTSVETIGDKLRRLEEENKRLEREKELMEERAKLEKVMDLLEKKKAWLEFDEARDRAWELKTQKETMKKKLKKAQSGLRPLRERCGKINTDVQRMKSRYSSLEPGMHRANTEYEKCLRKAETYQDEIESDLQNLTSIDSLQRRAERHVAIQRERVEELKSQMADYPPEEEIEKALREAQTEIRAVKAKLSKAQRDYGQVNTQIRELNEQVAASEAKLDKMNDDRTMRNQRIFRQQPQLYETYKWVEQNRKMFRRPVWGPVACEVTPKSKNAAAYLEQHVANSILKAYVVECEEDYNLLYREVREKLKLAINIVKVQSGKLSPIDRLYKEEKMNILKKEHHVLGYLDESFIAPDAILQALRDTSNVHAVLVGSSKTQDSIDRHSLLDFLGEKENGQSGVQASCIFTSHMDRSYKYTTQASRYSGKAFMRVDDVPPPKMLAPGVNPEQKAALEQSIEDLRGQIEELRPQAESTKQSADDITAQGQAIGQRLKDAKAAKNDLKNFQMKLATAERKLRESEEAASKDNVAEKEALLEKLNQHVLNSVNAIETAGRRYMDMTKSTFTLAGVKVTEDVLVARAQKIQDELLEREGETNELKQQVARTEASFKEVKEEMKKLKERAEAIAQVKDADGNHLPIFYELEELPGTLNQVVAALEEATSKVNSITDNPEVLRQYEERKKEIERTRQEMEGLSEVQDAKRAEIDGLKVPWEAALDNCVEKVNIKFQEYMKELGCAGEVELSKGESLGASGEGGGVFNFRLWGIKILVKFREKSSLQVLSAQVHSGGERSVSTIMYLMALQELMVSPFRCVDEINQGLDERNERLVFKRIVTNSTRPPEVVSDPRSHAGQYFLITPKLLPNLTDMENEGVTILFIFNGPYNFKHFSDWNPDRFIEARKSCLVNGFSAAGYAARRNDHSEPGDEDEKENRSADKNTGWRQSGSHKKKRRISD